jgi:hypothetical protein
MADFSRVRDQVRLSTAAQLATGRLPASHDNRHGISECVYYQARGLRPSQGIPGHRSAYLDWCRHDSIPDFLCSDRK